MSSKIGLSSNYRSISPLKDLKTKPKLEKKQSSFVRDSFKVAGKSLLKLCLDIPVGVILTGVVVGSKAYDKVNNYFPRRISSQESSMFQKASDGLKFLGKGIAMLGLVAVGVGVGAAVGSGVGASRLVSTVHRQQGPESNSDLSERQKANLIPENKKEVVDAFLLELEAFDKSQPNLKTEQNSFEDPSSPLDNDLVSHLESVDMSEKDYNKLKPSAQKILNGIFERFDNITELDQVPKVTKESSYKLDTFLEDKEILKDYSIDVGSLNLTELEKTYARSKIEILKTRGNTPEGIRELEDEFKIGDETFTTKVRNGSSDRVKEGNKFIPSALGGVEGNAVTNLHVQTVEDKDGNTKAHLIRHGVIHVSIKKMSQEEKNAVKLLDGETRPISDDDLKKRILTNKAVELAKAAITEGLVDEDGNVHLTSLSLLTPDIFRGHELHMLQDQQEAFELLQNLSAEEKKEYGLESNNFTVSAFNFGVNEGEAAGRANQKDYNTNAMKVLNQTTEKFLNFKKSLIDYDINNPKKETKAILDSKIKNNIKKLENLEKYGTASPNPNQKSMWYESKLDQLEPKAKAEIDQQIQLLKDENAFFNQVLDGNLSPENKAKLTVEISTIDTLQKDIEAKYIKFNSINSWVQHNQVKLGYQLTEKIGMLTELTGGAHCANCASGKDRTGEHSATFCGYAAKMDSRMKEMTETLKQALQEDPDMDIKIDIDIRDNVEMIDDENTDNVEKARLQVENRGVYEHSHQFAIQKRNTGSEGGKLFGDNAVSALTRGVSGILDKEGSTEKYFETKYGLAKDGLRAWYNRRSKQNET